MDKRKLVNIILKDLEEIKILSEEVAESQIDSTLLIELALNRARLLCQEIELLREITPKSAAVIQAFEDAPVDSDEDDEEEHHYSDPELEIINFEDRESEEEEELPEEEEEYLKEDEEENPEEEEDEDEVELEEEDLNEKIVQELEEEEPEFIGEEEEEEDLKEEEEEPALEEEKAQPAATIQSTELKNESQPGIREIHIDDMDDDDDIEPIRFSPAPGANVRPPMREIPKPEDIIENHDKMLIGEKYQKERSINDTLGEHKAMDSKLAHGPIPNLKSAIGLNDRFLFIREIFNNNSAKYNEVIDRLDQMEHIQEAVEFLKANLSMQKNEASMKFVELLKRRFTK